MDSQLQRKVVLITGASGGIGSAISRKFAAEPARLVLHYRSSAERASALQKELGSAELILLKADLTKESDAKRLFAEAVKRFGRVDTLIANAGAWETRDVPLHEMSLKQWQAT